MFKKEDVIFEDNHLIAVNKHPGDLVQEDDGGDLPLDEMIKAYIGKKYDKPGAVFLGVIHRIDRPVSGVCLFARTSKALERMNKLFSERKVEKTYWALVEGRPEEREGTLVHYLLKDTTTNKTKAYKKEHSGSVRAELHYKTLTIYKHYSLLEVKPVTGRPHQIRVQLASLGTPILGDLKYGSKAATEDKSICLHSRSLEFLHPVKQDKVYIKAKPHKGSAFYKMLIDLGYIE